MTVSPADVKERALSSAFDVERVRAQFPILARTVNGRPLAYLDNAATTQKPQAVIDAVSRYYAQTNANIHRGVHQLSARATEAYEESRRKVQRFVRAARPEEIVFVRGTTEAINLLAQTYGRTHVREGDEVLITAMEHHSNIVPWQMLCEQVGAKLRVAPINDDGEVIFEEYVRLLGPRTKLVGMVHVSNALGTINADGMVEMPNVNPVREMIAAAHERGIPVLLDGAQAVPHLSVDVCSLDCDFFAFSGHKMFGPTGIGVLYAKFDVLDRLGPYQGGGDMIKSVTFEKTLYNDLPYRFEAGTPNIAGAIGLGAAIDFLTGIGLDRIAAYERDLLAYATGALTSIEGVRLIGTAGHKASVLSFTLGDVHAHDVGTILDQHGVAVRTGHHCAQPVMDHFGVPATTRASLALYNTRADIDALVEGIGHVVKVFS